MKILVSFLIPFLTVSKKLPVNAAGVFMTKIIYTELGQKNPKPKCDPLSL